MFGDVGFTFPVDLRTGAGDASQMEHAFLGGGKMIEYGKGGKPVRPWNTTISGIVVVSALEVGSLRLGVAIAVRERDLGRDLSLDERLAMLEDWRDRVSSSGSAALRVRIYENPFAVKPLRRNFGLGPWDERFGPEGERLVRVYVGPSLSLATLEEEETATGIKVDPWKWTG
jgi:hypothetical protein